MRKVGPASIASRRSPPIAERANWSDADHSSGPASTRNMSLLAFVALIVVDVVDHASTADLLALHARGILESLSLVSNSLSVCRRRAKKRTYCSTSLAMRSSSFRFAWFSLTPAKACRCIVWRTVASSRSSVW